MLPKQYIQDWLKDKVTPTTKLTDGKGEGLTLYTIARHLGTTQPKLYEMAFGTRSLWPSMVRKLSKFIPEYDAGHWQVVRDGTKKVLVWREVPIQNNKYSVNLGSMTLQKVQPMPIKEGMPSFSSIWGKK